MSKELALFVHGVRSTGKAWDPLIELLLQDPELDELYDFECFEYDSPLFSVRPGRRIPDFNSIADSLSIFIENRAQKYRRICLVTHSQGGLIAMRFLARQLAEGRGRELAVIRGLVAFACPNNGSEFVLSLRKWVAVGHRQERELRPLADSVIETQRRVLTDVVYARTLSDRTCPIPIFSYAGDSDDIVTPTSAKSVFPHVGVVPGDHSSLIRPNGPDHLTYIALRKSLLAALSGPFPTEARPGGVSDITSDDVHVELSSRGPIVVSLQGTSLPVHVHSGPIDQLSDIDVVATSENVYMQMAMTFKPSVSGRLRRASARKAPTGEIVEDTTFDELNEWMREHGRYGLPVELGTVAPTSAGELETRGIRRIYHAAIGIPILGTDGFSVNSQSVATAVHNVFVLARRERKELGIPLESIGLPLFGAGIGGLDFATCFEWMWRAIEYEAKMDGPWVVHFCTWSRAETEMIVEAIHAKGGLETK